MIVSIRPFSMEFSRTAANEQRYRLLAVVSISWKNGFGRVYRILSPRSANGLSSHIVVWRCANVQIKGRLSKAGQSVEQFNIILGACWCIDARISRRCHWKYVEGRRKPLVWRKLQHYSGSTREKTLTWPRKEAGLTDQKKDNKQEG